MTSQQTVDELLKMLSGGNRSKGHARPPPVPPKPRNSIIDHLSSNISTAQHGFKRYFSSSTSSTSKTSVTSVNDLPLTNTTFTADEVDSGFDFNGSGGGTRKYDVHPLSKQHQEQWRPHTGKPSDNNDHDYTNNNHGITPQQPSSNTSSIAKYSFQHQQKQSPTFTTAQRSNLLPNDPLLVGVTVDQQPLPMTITIVNNDYDCHHSVKQPIVIESSSEEEANNNNINKAKKAINSTSTVEILEVPVKQKLHTLANDGVGGGTRDSVYGSNNTIHITNPNFNRPSRHHLFYENNNSYAAPVVTTVSDDEGGDENENQNDTDGTLPTEMEVESILNESSLSQPPRTSTPNSSSSQSAPNATTHLSASKNNTYANRRSQVSIVKLQQDGAFGDEDDSNILNSSHDTDDLCNTSALNQSGGPELIGINDNSDQANASQNMGGEKVPYTVQLFNDTMMSTSNSATKPFGLNPRNHTCHEQIKELEKVIRPMVENFEKLQAQVHSMSNKIEELEQLVDEQQETIRRLKGNKLELISNSNNLSSNFSKSTSTINRITPLLDSGSNFQNPGGQKSSSNYSSNIATISKNNLNSTYGGSMSNQMNHSTNKATSSHSCNNAVTKPLKTINIHASTNSIYAESFKSGSTSISPTNNYLNQSTSPTSIMNVSTRREPLAHTSMLSLSSIGNPIGSTLKKTSAASGSVSNLSQVGSQLSQWPSISDFVPSKHRAKDLIYSEEERLIRMVMYNRLITMRVPSWVESDYNIDKVLEPPNVRLKLDWVYGYRGRDCRSNLFYLPTGECVYFVASIVVLYNPEEKTQRHYLGHTESVKCLAIHPNKLTIASGQSAIQNRRDKRPIVRVWNSVNLSTLRVIEFNQDLDRSICCLAFSKHDQGATLAVVDESNEHTITLLDWNREKSWRMAETNSGHEPVLAIDFHPIDKYSLVAVGKSSINFWDIRGMTLTKKAGLFDKYDKPKYVLCLTFNDIGDTITGDSNGNIMVWPRGGNRPKRVIHDCHEGGVFSVLAMKDGSYMSGGRDRRIVEWDESLNRTGREAQLSEHCGGIRYITYAKGSQVLIGTLRNSILLGSFETNFTLIMQGHAEATSALAIHPSQNQYLTGGFDDQIHLFDSQSHEVIWTKCLMMPATSASFSTNGSLLVVGSTLGKWLVLDAITKELLFTKCDGSGTIKSIKFSPDGESFAMGSSDAHIYVYQTSKAGSKFYRIGTCVGHSAPVKEVDWSDDGRYLQSQSMNLELLFWKAANCRPLEDADIVDDLRWSTHNCSVGFGVIGIWSDSIDSALVNHCDKSNNEDLMVSATDTGNINIFKWPPCYSQCLSQKYYGNVEKFDFIKFLPDDSRLIAVGAKTCVTTEWIVDKGELL